jgi:hypothetical protein
MTPGKLKVLEEIVSASQTPMWDCVYGILKLVRKRKVDSDCKNLERAIMWARTLPHDFLAKQLIAYRQQMRC